MTWQLRMLAASRLQSQRTLWFATFAWRGRCRVAGRLVVGCGVGSPSNGDAVGSEASSADAVQWGPLG